MEKCRQCKLLPDLGSTSLPFPSLLLPKPTENSSQVFFPSQQDLQESTSPRGLENGFPNVAEVFSFLPDCTISTFLRAGALTRDGMLW